MESSHSIGNMGQCCRSPCASSTLAICGIALIAIAIVGLLHTHGLTHVGAKLATMGNPALYSLLAISSASIVTAVALTCFPCRRPLRGSLEPLSLPEDEKHKAMQDAFYWDDYETNPESDSAYRFAHMCFSEAIQRNIRDLPCKNYMTARLIDAGRQDYNVYLDGIHIVRRDEDKSLHVAHCRPETDIANRPVWWPYATNKWYTREKISQLFTEAGYSLFGTGDDLTWDDVVAKLHFNSINGLS